MKIWFASLLIVCSFFTSNGNLPVTVKKGVIPFMVYFTSRYRGICVGFMVSRSVAVTAASCVTSPFLTKPDTRPLHVVAGTNYRHHLRGMRVAVSKVLLPKMPKSETEKAYLISISVAVLLLRNHVPDLVTEFPVLGVAMDFMGETIPQQREECVTFGWHFHKKDDIIFEPFKFAMDRDLKMQFLHLVKPLGYCEPLLLMMKLGMQNLGYIGNITAEVYCTKDIYKVAQPCHGMYGAPLVCGGKVVGVMTSPDSQYHNCTGHVNVFHPISSKHNFDMLSCIADYLQPEFIVNMDRLYRNTLNHEEAYDLSELYDKLHHSSEEVEKQSPTPRILIRPTNPKHLGSDSSMEYDTNVTQNISY